MLRRVLFAVPMILAAATAHASGKKAEEDEKTATGQYVDLAPVALPIVVRGQLVNYVFAYVRINLAPNANAVKVREKEPYFRDALVRAAHRTPFTDMKDYMVVDTPKLTTTLQREAAAIAGPGVVRSVVVTSQAPKKRTGVPKPRAAA